MRVFFALKLSSPAQKSLEGVARLIEANGAKLVAPENYHVTLAFVGAVERRHLEQLRFIAKQLRSVQGEVRVDRIERWGNPTSLVAAGAQVSTQLAQLAEELQAAAACFQGETVERRHWRPHVTLARNASQATVLQAMSPIYWIPTEFVLMDSTPTPRGAVYTVVDTWPLLDKHEAIAKSR